MPKMKTPLRVAVIGGGWAGLAAAVELSAAGVNVTIFEAAKQLGGRARSVDIQGQTLDNGQHILLGAYRETLRLMQLVGAKPEQMLKRLPLELNHPAAGFKFRLPRLPAPFHLACGLLMARGVSLGEKWAAVRFLRALQTDDYQLDTDCTVAELLDRHQQFGTPRRFLWEPLCLAALNTAALNASAQIFANVLRDSLGGGRADTDLLLPATDLGHVFPHAAAEFVRAHGGRIHFSTRIDRLAPNGAQQTIYGEHFDHVILAVAPQHASALLVEQVETAPIATLLADYRYEPIGTVYAAYPPEVTLPCPMLGLESRQERGTTGGVGQWVFDRSALGGAPGVMSFVLSANGVWDEPDSAVLMTALHRELEVALGRKLPPARWHQLIRESRATFSCRPNLPRPSARTALHGLWLAGDYVCAGYPATLEGAVRSGVAAANGILQSP